MRGFLTAVCIVALMGVDVAQAQPAPGLETVDETQAPWSGVAMINNSVYGRCTGALIAPDVVLTAAHYLYSRRTGVFVRPQSVHVLLGYNRGEYGFHTVAAEVTLGDGYDPAAPTSSLTSDYALLRLVDEAPSGFVPLTIASGTAAGRSVVAAGFAQERSQVLTATPSCSVQGRSAEGLIVSDCIVSRGLSGGPLIDRKTGELVGIQVAGGRRDGRVFALAVPAAEIPRDLPPP